jgi:hypothetical protein
MTAAVVTSFISIPDHPRSMEEYARLAQPLLTMPVHMLDMVIKLEDCWLFEYLEERFPGMKGFTHSVADNPAKNSLMYHIVQAQKTELLATAAMLDRVSDVFIWIDYGILGLSGVTVDIIKAFVQRATNEQAIVVPGCWDKPYAYRDDYPCWRFCGGVMIVPRDYAYQFHIAMRDEYIRWLNVTGNISWEVNTLARLEKRDKLMPLWWYKADHDSSIFTNYKTGVLADGRCTGLVGGDAVDHGAVRETGHS